MENKILNIIKEADDGVTYKEIMNNFTPSEDILVQTTIDILRDGKKSIKFDKDSKKFYYNSIMSEASLKDNHNSPSEVVAEPVNNKTVTINGKVCYLSKNNKKIYLNWYNPRAEDYERIVVTDKENTLKWLSKFNPVTTTEDLKKNKEDNKLLWNKY